jgi:hypothetical protein
MMTYRKACKMVVNGFDTEKLKYGNKKFNTKETKILKDVLRIESKVFDIFIKTKKCSLKAFPFESINVGYTMDRRTATSIAKLLLTEGWKPETHVKNTIEKYKRYSGYATIGNIS